ncbi:MAG TPA: PAS domain-containing sensor histidine kinase [Gemmatimonadales bacterium]|jgi:PAS domain-containing protein/two-component sensor histidine kinase|nr:PAS domain-containing sensor histidine kinase [Gemmatimonadales bacterium]
MAADIEVPDRGVWARVVGPLVALVVCVALWLLAWLGGVRLVPAPFFCVAVAFAALRGRIVGGAAATAIVVIYALAAPGLLGTPPSPPTITDLVVLTLLLLALVFLVSSRVDWLQARVESALTAAATAERRASLVTGDAARRATESSDAGRVYEELRAQAERDAQALGMLEAALDSVAQGVAVVDGKANVVWWNRALAVMSGVPVERRGEEGAGPSMPFLDRAQLLRSLESGETVTRLSGPAPGNGDRSEAYVQQYAPVETASGERFVAVTVAQVLPGTNGSGAAPAAPVADSAAPPAPAAPLAPPGGRAALASPSDPMVLDPEVIDTLRAPLAAIREYVWFMVAGPDEPRRRANDEYGSRVLGAAQQMDDRIAALLEYSQVLRGPIRLNDVQLDEVVRDALQGLEPGLTASGARVRIVAQPAPGPVAGDRQLLTLAVTHLIGNAIKYVPPDMPPRVLVWMEQVDGRARLSVEDNGIGIQKGEERRLFRLFERLPDAEAYPGNGVGLAVVRAAVERMGGRVGVQSEPGWGSRFWIELREAAGSGEPAAEAALPAVELPPIVRPEGSSFAGIGEEEWRPL